MFKIFQNIKEKIRENKIKTVVSNLNLDALPRKFVVFDLETSGFKPDQHEIIEIAATKHDLDCDTFEEFQTLVRIDGRLSSKIVKITGITKDEIKNNGIALEDAFQMFENFISDFTLIAFNAPFDIGFLNAAAQKLGKQPFKNEKLCALKFARAVYPNLESHKLGYISEKLGLNMDAQHRALGDARRTFAFFVHLVNESGGYKKAKINI